MGTAGHATQNLKLMVTQQSVIEFAKTDPERKKSMSVHVPDSIAIGRCRPNVSIRYENAFETKKRKRNYFRKKSNKRNLLSLHVEDPSQVKLIQHKGQQSNLQSLCSWMLWVTLTK